MSTKPVVLISCRTGMVDWATSGDVDVFLVDTDCQDEEDEITALPATEEVKKLVAKLGLQDHVEFVKPLVTPPLAPPESLLEDVLSVRNFDDDRFIHAYLAKDDRVEFYDGNGTASVLPGGKLGSYITAYRPKTLADRNQEDGLMLNAACPEWSLSPFAVTEIVGWLQRKGVL